MNFHVARARGIVNKTLAPVALGLTDLASLTAAPKLNIRTKNDLPQGVQRKQRRGRLARHYDLGDYTTTRDNLIERRAIKDSSLPEIFRETAPRVNDSEGRCLNATTSIKS
jgi:hypothetical protein